MVNKERSLLSLAGDLWPQQKAERTNSIHPLRFIDKVRTVLGFAPVPHRDLQAEFIWSKHYILLRDAAKRAFYRLQGRPVAQHLDRISTSSEQVLWLIAWRLGGPDGAPLYGREVMSGRFVPISRGDLYYHKLSFDMRRLIPADCSGLGYDNLQLKKRDLERQIAHLAEIDI